LLYCSLPIHLPQCQAKWQQQQALLPPAQRLPLPQPPAAVAAMLGGESPLPAGKGLQVTAVLIAQYVEAALHYKNHTASLHF
jgi:hypothetical protein